MKLQHKSVFGFNFFVVVVCVCMCYLGYRSANNGFEVALTDKANADIRSAFEITSLTYPGDWSVRNGKLYKGDIQIDGNNAFVDKLGKITGNNVTIFCGDTRIATTFVKGDGTRATGTKASEAVIKQVLTDGKDFHGYADVLGNRYFSVYNVIKNAKGEKVGMMFMGIPTKDIDELQHGYLKTMGFTALVVIVVLGSIGWFVVGAVVKPLLALKSQLAVIASGNLKAEDINLDSGDEIAEVASSANQMKGSLHEVMIQCAHSAEQVAASSEELTASASQTATTVHQVAESVCKMAEGADQQSTALEAVTNQAENLDTKMSSLNESALVMKNVAEDSRKNAASGRESVEHAVDQIKRMAVQMNASAKVVETLGERSNEIGQIVETISNIAGQTNLLALNAAIEAARAGEAGRGFAVVAEEVRKLAEQSGEAATSIAGLIGAIQDDTNEAVVAIKKGNEEVQAGSQVVSEAGEAFAHIEQLISDLYAHVEASLKNINDAKDSSQSIVSAVTEVQRVSVEVANEAQNVSASTEEQAATMQEIVQASQSLADMAQKLQNEVNKFEV